MMTFAWAFTLVLDENLKPNCNEYTFNYLTSLVMQLSNEQRLYAEIRWRDPI